MGGQSQELIVEAGQPPDQKRLKKLKGSFNAKNQKNFWSDFRSEITPELKGLSEKTLELKGLSEQSR